MLEKIKAKIKFYVSGTDCFLKTFDRDHPEQSASQQAEIAKHDAIAAKRDHVTSTKTESAVWDRF